MRTAFRLGSRFKVLGSSLLLVIIFLLIPSPALAFPWDAQSQSTYTLGNLIKSGVVGLSGVCTDGSIEDVNKKIKPCSEVKLSGGAIGVTTGVLASLYNPPISSVYYLANLGEGLGLGPNTAYAQVGGSGAEIVVPVFKLWQISRNLTYLVFIVVFVVVGFMIMFRQKLNPQTIIGVQQALPGLIIGLILVTFSYFIASLIVDFAFVGIQLVAQFFTLDGGPPNSLGNINDLAQNANIFSLFGKSAFNGNNLGIVWQGVSGQLTQITGGNTLNSSFAIGGIATIIGFLVAGPFGLLAGGAGALAIPVIIPALVCLILLIALFIQMFKLLLALLSAYISILIMTFAGPFFILAGSIPGKSSAISTWIKNLVANVLIFPAVFGGFLFAGVILGDTTSWQGTTTLPLFGGLDKNFIRVLIAYGILLGIPGIPPAIKGALGVKDQNPITQAAMGGAMGGFGVTSGAAGKGWGATGIPDAQKEYRGARAKVAGGVPGAIPPVVPAGRFIPGKQALIKHWPF